MPNDNGPSVLAELFSISVSYLAAFLAQIGTSFWNIVSAAIDKFPGLSTSVIEAEVQTGLEAVQVGSGYRKLGMNRRFPLSRIPILSDLSSNFQYMLTVWCADDTGHNQQYRTVLINSDSNLTRAEISQAGTDAFRAMLATDKYTLLSLACDPSLMGVMDVQAVFRRQ